MTLRHFINSTDISADELREVLQLSTASPEALGKPLAGLGAALIFEKSSNRTRHSMELAVVQLGGHPVYTRGEEVGLDVRETVEDITKVMGGYHAILAARVFDHNIVRRMADSSSVPVVNMLSDRQHPLQGLADVLTMQQQLGDLVGKTVCYVGDYNNVARSLAQASALLGMHVRLGCPIGYQAEDGELQALQKLGAASVKQFDNMKDAVSGANAVHTDVWTSMGQESETSKREKAFANFQVTEVVMKDAAADAIFMHCLPAHRGMEVAAEVIDGPRSKVFEQAHNRMHAARGLLAFLMGVNV
jgi:ornithine carbamoyltransferase